MANTEAFYQFHRFNEAFDRDLKVTFGALEGLRMGAFPAVGDRTNLPIGKEPWRKLTSLKDPIASADSAIRQISTMGIVRASAALEDFLTTLEADYARTEFLRKAQLAQAPIEPKPEWKDLDIPKACVRLGIDPALVGFAMPLHDYFNAARNCIVHRNGRASSDLEKIARSEDFLACLAAWQKNRGSRLPVLPIIREGDETDWLPRHAILCVTVYYTAAGLINEHMVAKFGLNGFVYMAAHHSLLDSEPVDSGARRSAESVVLTLLQGRYRYRGVKAAEIVAILKSVDKWKLCLNRFEALKQRWRAE